MVNHNLVGGWYTYPSEKWWSESQLGWWHSQYMESYKIPVPKTTNQMVIITRWEKQKIFQTTKQINID